MQTYLFLGKYTATGRRGLLDEGGSAREKVTQELFEGKVGGKIRHYAFSEGDFDFMVLVDLPDDQARSAITLLTTSGGYIDIISLKLITPVEMDKISDRASQIMFRQPGRPQ